MRSLLLLAALATVPSCSDDDSGSGVYNGWQFQRASAAAIEFPDNANLYAWCAPWEPEVQVDTVHLFYGTTQQPMAARWQLRAVIADVTIGTPLTLPNEFIWDQPRNADLFVFDPPNELSSQQASSAGTITFQDLACEPGATARISIDATIGSELSDGQSITVRGELAVEIGQAPSFGP